MIERKLLRGCVCLSSYSPKVLRFIAFDALDELLPLLLPLPLLPALLPLLAPVLETASTSNTIELMVGLRSSKDLRECRMQIRSGSGLGIARGELGRATVKDCFVRVTAGNVYC